MFVLNYWLREFVLSEIANRFEFRCEPKQLMLLYDKIYPYWSGIVFRIIVIIRSGILFGKIGIRKGYVF